jgi:hypothetical protein
MKSVANLILALFLAAASGLLMGQSSSGTIVGTVLDSSGAVIPEALVTARNPSTNNTTQTKTDTDGTFRFPNLPPATYELSVEKQGFQKSVRTGVVLFSADRLNAGNIVLAVGGTVESVTVVSADTGELQLQSASGERSAVITPVVLKDIALNGRNIFDLFKTMPGVIGGVPSNAGLSGMSSVRVNGTRYGMADVNLDAAPNKNTGAMNGGGGISINPDAIAEVKIVSSNYQAEYGVSGGASISMITKSGSNEFHGGGRYFRRHDSLNANNFFNKVVTPNTPRPLYRYNYYGGDIGGPVRIPHLIDGTNKLFFYWNEEYYGQVLPSGRRDVWMPTELQRKGNFSQTKDGNGAAILIRDPLASTGSTNVYFPDNIIPASRISAEGASAINFFPMPNFEGDNRYNYTSQASEEYPRREDIVRVDYHPSSGTRISGRFVNNMDRHRQPYGPPFNGWSWPLTLGQYDQPATNISLSVTSTLSPSLVNEFTYGRNRSEVIIGPLDDALSRASTGITTPLLYPDAVKVKASPSLSFGGISNWNAPSLTVGYPFYQDMPITSITDNLTKVHGAHIFKVGVGIYLGREFAYKTNHPSPNTQSNINFGVNTSNPLDSRHPFANALLGVYNSYSQVKNEITSDIRYHNIEWFAQDSWRVRRGLTLDYGMRFVMAPFPAPDNGRPFYTDIYQRNNAALLYAPIRLASGERRAVNPAAIPDNPDATNTFPVSYVGLLVPGTGDLENGIAAAGGTLTKYPAISFAPRFGFAYSPFANEKTVIRGGFGMSYDRTRTSVAGQMTINPPAAFATTLTNGWLSDIETLGSGGGLVVGVPLGAPGADGLERSSHVPTVMSFSLGVQRNVGLGMVLDVSYVGNLQQHLAQTRDINAIPFGSAFSREGQDPSQFAGGVVPEVEPGLPAAYAEAGINFTGRYALPVNLRRPYQGYGAIILRTWDSSANYNSMQVTLNRRFGKTLVLNASYTWSKTLGTAWDDQSGGTTPFDSRGHDYLVATWDRTHTFTINYVLTAPQFGSRLGGGRFVRAALNGWQISGLTTAYTGTPLDLGVGISGAGGWAFTGSESVNPRFYIDNSAGSPPAGMHISPERFVVPPLGSQGYGSARFLRNPGFTQFDLALFKNFHYSSNESRYVQFRLETFNLPNQTLFTSINGGTNLTAPNGTTGFGVFNYPLSSLAITNNLRGTGTRQIGSYFGEYNGALANRVIQLAVKLYF